MKTRFLGGAVTTLLLMVSTANAGSLAVSLLPQQQSNWCWAASGQMIMNYLGATQESQCDEANRRFGRTDCCVNPSSTSCNIGGWPEFDKYGFTFSTYGAALPWSSLVSEINANRPVAFSWHWTGGGGHMMVARGYLVSNNVDYVDVNNPWAPNVGDQYYTTYSDYVSGSDHTHWTDYYAIQNNPPCFSDFNDVSADSFQACFDYWALRNRWPTTLTAYNVGGTIEMAGSFQAVPSRPVRTLMTGAQFQSYFNTYNSQGWRPDQITVLPTSSGPLFTVIWAPIDGAFQTWFGLDTAGFNAKSVEMSNAGYVNIDLSAYDNGGTYYAATWVQKAGLSAITNISMDSTTYNSLFSYYASYGWRPSRFSAFYTPSGTRYAAIWIPATTGFYMWYGQTDAAYQSNYNWVTGLNQGFKLSFVSGFNNVLSSIWTQ
jgi:hypothetical protein